MDKLKIRKCHFAEFVRADGAMSALCFKTPRKIDLTKAYWTLIEDQVDCKKCLKILSITPPKPTEKGE